MKCYYEELGVAREASDAEIKGAYRKLALRWHPDKNPDSAETAKVQFQLIQQAYDVLSDSQERAWYDNHREQILRGKNSNYEDECLDLFQYFTVSCFKGYSDDESSFYRVYGRVFEQLAAEDMEFMDNSEEIANIPKFGDSKSNYDEVVGPFYAYWQSYCTKKTYAWLCPYDVQEIRERRILREIEKDMKKIVQKAKKERNEEVRNLVSFIRKRDKRVLNYKKHLEERATLNRQKQEQNRIEQIRRRNREVEELRKTNNNIALNEDYEDQLKELEQQYKESSCDEEDDSVYSDDNEDYQQLSGAVDAVNITEESEYFDELYCVACNRAFKNEKAFANHESSRKHRDNAARLKQEMLAEEEHFGKNGAKVESELEDNVDIKEEMEDVKKTANSKKTAKREKRNHKSKKANKLNIELDMDASDNEVVIVEEIHTKISEEENEVDWSNLNKRNAGRKNKKQKIKSNEIKENNSIHNAPTMKLSSSEENADTVIKTEPTCTHCCMTCKSTFESKNKLFAHLKQLNHGIYLPKTMDVPLDIGKKLKSKKK